MDRFTRIYSIVLGIVGLAAITLWINSMWQPRVWELNEVLEEHPKLTGYPYQFRVRGIEDGVATLSTPRSFDVPAYRFLEIIHPNLANKAQDDPAMVAAQQELIDHQKLAQGLILAQPGVDRVDWELDTRWLADHGVHAPAQR